MLSSLELSVDYLLSFTILSACILSLLLNYSFDTADSEPFTEHESLDWIPSSRFIIFSLDSKFLRVYDPFELSEVRLLFNSLALVVKSSSENFLDL